MRKANKKQSRRKDNVTMTVTKKDYQRELAAGVEPEFAFKPGKHKFVRGGFLKRHHLSPEQAREMTRPENIRAAISIKIPLDVLDFFKAESERTGKPYQTQINDVLRAHVDGHLAGTEDDPVAALRRATQLIKTAEGQIHKKHPA